MPAMQATVDWLSGMAFRGAANGGHAVTLDADREAGGLDRGMRPLELLLLALGGCTGMDGISILHKMRQDVTDDQVSVHGERAGQHPRVFTAITVEHVVRGRNLNSDAVRRAVELPANRSCPLSAMLGRAVAVEERYRVVDEATGAEIAGMLATLPRLDLPRRH